MARESTSRTIRMPKWGLSMLEGTITHFHVKPGDRITAGAPFCDIETTKITNEFEAPASGIVAHLLVGPDEVVVVGQPIAILAEDDATEADIDAALAAAATAEDEPQADLEANVSTVRYVDVPGSRLAYLESGDPASGQPVVFLHGFGADHAAWALSQSTVGDAGHWTFAFDLPGHGASGKAVGDGSAEAVARPIRAALEALGLRRIAPFAHSFGALVAAALAREAALEIGPVVLIAPVGLGPAPNPAYVRGFLAAERKRDMKPVMEMLFADPAMLGRGIVSEALASLRDDERRAALERIGQALLDLSLEQLRGTWDLMAPDWHVVWGDRDIVVPLDADVTKMLGSALHQVPDAGHLPQVEKAALVNALVSRLLLLNP